MVRWRAVLAIQALLVVGLLAGCSLPGSPAGQPTPLPERSVAPPVKAATPAPTPVPTPFVSAIEFRDAQRYSVIYTVTADNRGFALDELRVYLPQPIAWDGQAQVIVERVSPEPVQQGVDPVHGNAMY